MRTAGDEKYFDAGHFVPRCALDSSMNVQNAATRSVAMTDKKSIASVEKIESRIFLIRGQKVMLDEDFAALYGVETRRFNE